MAFFGRFRTMTLVIASTLIGCGATPLSDELPAENSALSVTDSEPATRAPEIPKELLLHFFVRYGEHCFVLGKEIESPELSDLGELLPESSWCNASSVFWNQKQIIEEPMYFTVFSLDNTVVLESRKSGQLAVKGNPNRKDFEENDTVYYSYKLENCPAPASVGLIPNGDFSERSHLSIAANQALPKATFKKFEHITNEMEFEVRDGILFQLRTGAGNHIFPFEDDRSKIMSSLRVGDFRVDVTPSKEEPDVSKTHTREYHNPVLKVGELVVGGIENTTPKGIIETETAHLVVFEAELKALVYRIEKGSTRMLFNKELPRDPNQYGYCN